jgi:FkbM family methyltransferase
MQQRNLISRIRNRFKDVPDYITGFRFFYGLRLLLKRFFLLPILVRTKNGSVVFLGLDGVDDTILRHLNDTHQHIYFFSSINLKKDDVVLDVGAHHGIYSQELGSRFPGIKIYSFEPDPKSMRYLKINRFLNFGKQITPIPSALDARSGMGYIVQSDEGSWGNYLSDLKEKDSAAISLISITDFLMQYKISSVALMKLNAEGSEFGILPQLFAAGVFPSRIILFAHPEKGDVEGLLKTIVQNGYKVEFERDDQYRPCYIFCLAN